MEEKHKFEDKIAKAGKGIIKEIIVVEITTFVLYIIFIFATSFKDFITTLVFSLILVNITYLLFRNFKRLNRAKSRVKYIFDLLNWLYSIFLSFSISEIVLKVIAFKSNKLDMSDIYTILITIFSVLVSNYISSLQEKLQKAELERKLQQMNFELVSSKFNPHFVFNTFNFLAETTRRNPEKAEEIIIKISDYYREVLKFKDRWTVKEELEFISKYLEIQKELLSHIPIDYEISCDSYASDSLIPTGITQPIVENAIKYGIKKNNGGIIQINVRVESGLCIEIKNSKSHSDEICIKKFGTGLTIVSKLLEFVSGRLEFLAEENSTIFRLYIPTTS
ncbi:MAG: sensor histidine kinase [Fervidobacterium sp.]|uniref:sensor histidine kinase n=1 Tax=Fervidobacterium sp. TaxID=1871331 RepID=UPI004049BA18